MTSPGPVFVSGCVVEELLPAEEAEADAFEFDEAAFEELAELVLFVPLLAMPLPEPLELGVVVLVEEVWPPEVLEVVE